MKRLVTSSFLSLFFILLAACTPPKPISDTTEPSVGTHELWVTDFAAASRTAKEEGKYMILNFTGSDWCGWCIKLEDEVFSRQAFKSYASENLVGVTLDFPRKKKIPAGTEAQNEALARKHNVRGFPTILILSPEGELVARTGYQRGGANAYVKHLQTLIEPHRKS